MNFPYPANVPGASLSDLIADSNGDLFGVAPGGPPNDVGDNFGVVYEIAKTAGGYASTPTTLATFDMVDSSPLGGLFADANGDLFGTTSAGAGNLSTVFEIAKTSTGYASAPTTLVTFSDTDGSPPGLQGDLIADAKGDLFGTAQWGGAKGVGSVFEIARTPSGYASTPTTLFSFDGVDGSEPTGRLMADANGDLFGAVANGPLVTEPTIIGPVTGLADGAVFEIAKTGNGYASNPTILASFRPLINGASPTGSLITDSNGDLFGTTSAGGGFSPFDYGTVFEIAKTADGYASTPTTLAIFQGPNGAKPVGSLIADSVGNLFGTTEEGGADPIYGTVFEIQRTLTGYASAPTTLISFDGANGGSPRAGLIADASGDLFGTTAAYNGTVFEITDSGFITASSAVSAELLLQNASTGQASVWEMDGSTRTGGGAVSVNPGLAWKAVGTGAFFKGDTSDILWQNTGTGQISVWEMDESTRTGGGAVSINPGPTWKAEPAISTTITFPTFFSRMRAPAKSRSGK